jgi:hypothetical protein
VRHRTFYLIPRLWHRGDLANPSFAAPAGGITPRLVPV